MKTNNTASSSLVIMLISFTAMLAPAPAPAVAFEFKVGNDMGWHVPPANNSKFYNYWASANRFRIGDSLSFEYKNDSVLMVEKWDYYHCNSSDPIVAFNNGKGLIKLDRAGPFFFISGFPDHCKRGQRLLVEVMSPHPIASTPSLPPESYYATDAAPSPSSDNAGAAVPVTGPVLVLLMAAVLELFLISF